MADWAAFTGVTFVVLSLLLLLSRATRTAMTDESGSITAPTEERDLLASDAADDPSAKAPDRSSAETVGDSPERAEPTAETDGTPEPGATADPDAAATTGRAAENPQNPFPPGSPSHETLSPDDDPEFSTGALLVNVALSQGLFGSLLVAAAWYTGVPASAFGIEPTPASTGWAALAVGVAAGVALYVANEVAAAALDRVGVESNEELRDVLAPDSAAGWAVLLGVVLPVIAAFEEFLFRAAVVGAVSTGFAVSPWAMAVVSTAAFALGHGMQGPGGVVVTGTLGFVLAALFIVTGSFLAVVVAHYLVNALEFAVHEGLGVDRGGMAG
ncbi:CPBP family intramembrane metalloprotease [Halostella sp. JP-L12]|uniref:CPBP family intramembrane glutamic endopeptidase n=1 Tax=Halostella TaxID=1843185 RepID=UPI000EF8004E|nr:MULTISPECIES: CPBP family intramembrane glutamic endopeptidase [Halostella]NHN47483.1 CPBP family intramembrane metalloprotease [Halostella sp. JP-L12]